MRQRLQAPVGPRHLQAIGAVTVNFALLDLQLRMLAGMQVSNDQRLGQIVTADRSFRDLLDLVVSLYRHHQPNESQWPIPDELVRRMAAAEERRNQISHSVWLGDESPETMMRIRMTARRRRGWDMQHELLSVEDIQRIADELSEIGYDVQQFMLKLVGLGAAQVASAEQSAADQSDDPP